MEINMLLIPIFVPLAVGFVLLFTPRKWTIVHKACGLFVSGLALFAAVKLYIGEKILYDRPLLDLWGMKLNFLLMTNHLNTFILLFAMGFGLLIALYSLKNTPAPIQSNFFYGALLLGFQKL